VTGTGKTTGVVKQKLLVILGLRPDLLGVVCVFWFLLLYFYMLRVLDYRLTTLSAL